MKKFLEDLEKELKKINISEEEIEEILEDHEEMIEEAIEEGLSEEELEVKFGKPQKIAKDIGGNRSKEDYSKEKKSEKAWAFEADDRFEIQIDLVDEDVYVSSSDCDRLTVELLGKGNPSDYTIAFEDNKLVINKNRNHFFGISFGHSRSGDFKISIPEKLATSYFKLKTISGDITVKNFETEDLYIKSTSGDAIIENMKTDDLKFESVSGDYSVRNVNAVDCFISLVSGDIDLVDFHVKENIKINTVSGDVKIEDASCVDLDLRTVSGDLDGNELYPESVALKSVSGDIRIRNREKEHNINVRYQKSVSGDIKIITK